MTSNAVILALCVASIAAAAWWALFKGPNGG